MQGFIQGKFSPVILKGPGGIVVLLWSGLLIISRIQPYEEDSHLHGSHWSEVWGAIKESRRLMILRAPANYCPLGQRRC